MKKRDKKYSGEYMTNPSASRYSQDSVIYIGKWYYFAEDKKTVKRAKILLLALSIINMGIFALGGLVDASASFTPYVFMPYVIMFLPLALSIGCCVSVMTMGEKITHKQYDRKICAQKLYSYAAVFLAAATLVGDIFMYAFKEIVDLKKDITFTLCILFIAISCAVCVKLQKNLICNCEIK